MLSLNDVALVALLDTMSCQCQGTPSGSFSTFWLLYHLSRSLSWQEIKRRILRKAAKLLAA